MVPSMPLATVPGSTKETAAPGAEVDHEVRCTPNILDVSAIPANWTVAVFKVQCPDFCDVRRFEAIFLDGLKENIYDHMKARCDMNIGGWNRRFPTLRMWCRGNMDP